MCAKDATPESRRGGRRPTGEIRERVGADGTVYRGLRFRAYGRRRTVSLGAVSAAEAQATLRHTLADVERGVWRPDTRAAAPVGPEPEQTFHEFASEWMARHEPRLMPRTIGDYRWRLTNHLLPYFKDHALGAITVQEVEAYVHHKQTQASGLGAESINKTVMLLGQILQTATRYDLISRNPARLGGVRLTPMRPERTYLDRADQIEALLIAAGELDAEARPDRRAISRRACIATMMFAGLRIGEVTGLRWRHVDLASGRLRVVAAKTDAGVREVDLLPVLQDELATWKATARDSAPAAYLFPSGTGKQQRPENIRGRVMKLSVRRADENLDDEDRAPLPAGLTPHSLRRTYISLLLATGYEVPYVMAQAGHRDPKVTLGIYAKVMYREAGGRERLAALIGTPVQQRGETARGATMR